MKQEELFLQLMADAMTGECMSCHKTDVIRDGICIECYEFHLKTSQDQSAPRKNGYKKQPIPDEIRWAVWERDNFTCRRCGTRKKLTVDHIYPEILGGEISMDNCQTLCKSCNSSKGTKTI